MCSLGSFPVCLKLALDFLTNPATIPVKEPTMKLRYVDASCTLQGKNASNLPAELPLQIEQTIEGYFGLISDTGYGTLYVGQCRFFNVFRNSFINAE